MYSILRASLAFSIIILFLCSPAVSQPELESTQSPSSQGHSDPISSKQTQGWGNEFLKVLYAGVVPSLIASVVFWYLLYRRKPRIKISNKIVRKLKDGKPEEVEFYLIKVVNLTRADIVNVKFELMIASPSEETTLVPTASNKRFEQIKEFLTGDYNTPIPRRQEFRVLTMRRIRIGVAKEVKEFLVIPKYTSLRKDLYREARYAQQFGIPLCDSESANDNQDLDVLLQSDGNGGRKFLIFNFYAVHPLSGFGKFVSQRYYKEDIETGHGFEFGKSINIKKYTQES